MTAQFASTTYQRPDRERRHNAELAQFVDIGLETYNQGNWSAAREFFANHHVPATIAVRVLFHCRQRRGR